MPNGIHDNVVAMQSGARHANAPASADGESLPPSPLLAPPWYGTIDLSILSMSASALTVVECIYGSASPALCARGGQKTVVRPREPKQRWRWGKKGAAGGPPVGGGWAADCAAALAAANVA